MPYLCHCDMFFFMLDVFALVDTSVIEKEEGDDVTVKRDMLALRVQGIIKYKKMGDMNC